MLIGLGIGLVFFLWSCLVLYAGYRLGNKIKPTKKEEANEEKLEQIRKQNEGWQNIWNYSYEKALEGGKK